jgi:hypothetical protein
MPCGHFTRADRQRSAEAVLGKIQESSVKAKIERQRNKKCLKNPKKYAGLTVNKSKDKNGSFLTVVPSEK